MENIPEWLKWIIGIFLSVGGTLGISKMLERRQERRYQLQDKTAEIHLTNQNRQIDFDQFAFEKFAQRLEIVERKLEKTEDELKEVRKDLSAQVALNATLAAENKHLKETNERQENEMIALREDRRILSGQVNSLTNIVTKLQTQIEAMPKT